MTRVLIAIAILSGARALASETAPLEGARQLVLVTAKGWDAVPAELQRYERARASGPWHAVGPRVAAVLGSSGLAWGRGLHGVQNGGPVKREGDRRAPAGAFRLSGAFGYGAKFLGKLPYTQVSSAIECIDDPSSTHYNQILDKTKVSPQDWKSVDKMLRADELYRLGLFVDHNKVDPVAGSGSCVFVHLWTDATVGTVGCTGLAPKNLGELARWLDPAKSPVLVQLPAADRARLRGAWGLP